MEGGKDSGIHFSHSVGPRRKREVEVSERVREVAKAEPEISLAESCSTTPEKLKKCHLSSCIAGLPRYFGSAAATFPQQN